MMKYLIIALGFIFSFQSLFSLENKDFNSLSLLQIIEKSKLEYKFENLTNFNPNEFYDSLSVISPNLFLAQKEGKFIPEYTNIYYTKHANKNLKFLLLSAEDYFAKSKYDSAISFYTTVYNADTTYQAIPIRIGECWQQQQNFEKAAYWFKKAVDIGFHCYQAHFYLGDCLKRLGYIDEALDEYLTAWVLNRNERYIGKSVINLCRETGKDIYADYFIPRAKVFSDKKTVTMQTQSNAVPLWTDYAISLAVYNFEPGFKEFHKKRIGISDFDEVNDKFISEEFAFFNMIIHLSKADKDSTNKVEFQLSKAAKNESPLFEIYLNALNNSKTEINTLISFEVSLPAFPQAAFWLPKEDILKTVEYIKNFRIRNLSKK